MKINKLWLIAGLSLWAMAGHGLSGFCLGTNMEQAKADSGLPFRETAGMPSAQAAPAAAQQEGNVRLDAGGPTGGSVIESTSVGRATDIHSAFQGEFRSYIKYLKLDTKKAQVELNKYLAESLGCSKVELCLTQIHQTSILASLFKNGKFELTLNTSCSAEFANFEFKFYPAFDFDERSHVYVYYDQPQGTVKKVFALGGMTVGEYNQVSDSDPSCY